MRVRWPPYRSLAAYGRKCNLATPSSTSSELVEVPRSTWTFSGNQRTSITSWRIILKSSPTGTDFDDVPAPNLPGPGGHQIRCRFGRDAWLVPVSGTAVRVHDRVRAGHRAQVGASSSSLARSGPPTCWRSACRPANPGPARFRLRQARSLEWGGAGSRTGNGALAR